MGLDSYLYKQKQKPKIEQVFDKLIDKEEEMEQVLYWRKNYNLLEWFRNNMCEIDNCKFHEVSKDILKKFLSEMYSDNLEYEGMYKDMEIITKILKETDFKTTKFFFYNWW